jgi:hypothetical protein
MKSKMKKFLYLFSSTILVLTSCSKDENNSEPVTPILVKKIINTYYVNDIETLTYKYDGNKIVSESSDGGFVANYTYTGNVITKIEERVDNKFQSSMEYTYNDSKVATAVLKRNYGGTISDSYTYNTNGTVSYKRSYDGVIYTGVLTIVNGNIVKNEVFQNGSLSSTHTYEYDTKNNPFKNVLGFNLLLDHDEDTFSTNNKTKDNTHNSNLELTFKYDSNNFPIEKKKNYGSDSGNSSGSLKELTQYFY